MNALNHRQSGGSKPLTAWMRVTLTITTLLLSACGAGSNDPSSGITPVAASCDPNNPATFSECGTLYVGLTDADGDFLAYSVDVVSLTLEKANGTTVETLPATTRIDFSQYVDLTEFVTAATIPPGTYIAGSITLDYTDSEIMVEAGDAAMETVVVDSNGNPIDLATFKIRLSDRDQLFISKGRPSLLTVDFDLAASHEVDITSTPAIAKAEPFIVAEVNPVDSKDLRVRGPLADVNSAEMVYTVALRPFYDRVGDFGRVKVQVTEQTEFDIDEVGYMGSEGLRALEAAGVGTPTVALGTLNVADREFTANIVLAGSSVPGSDTDAVKGNVIARNGNELVVRGGTVLLHDTRAFFRDDVTVTIGPDTRAYKTRQDGLLDNSAISVGQPVTIRGNVTANDEMSVHMDATEGTVRMHITHLSGIVNTVVPGQIDIDLHSIDRRRISVFDFSGTGASPGQDADPDNYEVSTGPLLMDADVTGRPVVAYGFPYEFGAAPPDFEGRTLIDYVDVRSALGVGWGAQGTTAPFLSTSSDGLVLDKQNEDIDQRHYIKHGPVLIDLTTLDSSTVITPRESGRQLFVIKTTDSLQQYAGFDDFVNALILELNGANTARSMYARGHYNTDTNVFTAYKIYIYLLEP